VVSHRGGVPNMIDDPLSLLSLGIWLMAAGMWPVGFLFGTCSACCCRTDTCDGFDLEEVYSRRTSGIEICNVSIGAGGTSFTSVDKRPNKGCKVSGTNIAPMTFIVAKTSGIFVPGIGTVFTYTFSPPTTGEVSGCISVCGRSGLCSTSRLPSDEGCGAFGSGASGFDECENDPPALIQGCDSWRRRRSCIRWLCRCYRSTGERALQNQDVSEWYEVVSTTVVGGPTTNDLDLENALVTAQCNGVSIEEYYLSNTTLGDFLNQAENTVGCIVWAFTFFGWTTDCETPFTEIPTQHESRDDCYNISPCTRCV
jgi:hypothetical protein